jgi:hypothetical protein
MLEAIEETDFPPGGARNAAVPSGEWRTGPGRRRPEVHLAGGGGCRWDGRIGKAADRENSLRPCSDPRFMLLPGQSLR